MKILLLFVAIAVCLYGQGTALTTGQWVDLSPGGYPVVPAGYDASTYTGATNASVVTFVNYLTIGVTSEGQDALAEYNYAENRMKILVDGGGWHGTHRSNMGHQMGVQPYFPSLNSVCWQANYSYGNNVDNYLTMECYDFGGHAAYEMPIMSFGGVLTRSWLQGAGGLLSAAAYDPTTGKFAIWPDNRNSTGTAQICSLGAGLAVTCTSAVTTGGPAAQINVGMAAQGGKFWIVGSGTQAVWTLNAATGAWANPATTCVGADCAGNAPAARYGPGWAWSPDDNLFMMAGGETVEGGGSSIIETWTFNPSTLVFTELCGPSLNPSNCSAFTYLVTKPGNRLVYDTVNHAFLWMTPTGGMVAYAIGNVAPLNYGRTTNVYNPTSGSLNKTAPGSNNTTQGWASDPSISTDGTTVYISHIETGTPATGGNCQVPLPYFRTAAGGDTYFPTGTLATGCAAIGGNTARATPSSHPYAAKVGSTLWSVFAKQNIDNYIGPITTVAFAQAYNTGTSLWNVPNFLPQTPVGDPSLVVGSNTVTLSPFPTGVTTSSVLRIFGGTGTEETVPVTAVNSGAGTVTVTTLNTHSGAYTISDSGWMGCFTRTCTYTVPPSDPKIHQYPQGLIAVGATPTAAIIEQDRTLTPHETYLYVAQLGANWQAVGGKWNIGAVGSGTGVADASIATDGGGVNVAACWKEQIDSTSSRSIMLTTPQIQCRLWNGTTATRMGTASLNLVATDWAYSPSIAFYQGSWYVAFTERAASGWPNVYVKKYNPIANTWALLTPGSLNHNVASGAAFHPILTADSTNLYLGWEEQNAIGQNALGYVSYWNGSWNVLGTAIAADSTNGSIEDIGIVAISGTVTAAWVEMKPGNLRQLYSTTLTATPGGFSVPITVQESLIGGTGGFAGLTRTNDPVTVGVPIPDSLGLTGTSTLGLSGAAAGQFTSMATWPSGNIKWLKIRAIIASVSAGGSATVTLTNAGSGNFGGSDMATDNGTSITVSTNGGTCGAGGAICFDIKKANFNFIDRLRIGATTVISTGTSTGIVVLGPSPTASYPGNVTCSPTSGGTACTTVYATSNDASSTCSIEENGPAVAVLKCTADLIDGAAHTYMHTTSRLYFYQGRAQLKYTVVKRNADYGTSSTFATASKGFQGLEIRVTPNITGTLNYTVANHTGTPTTGTMSGSDSTYLYQAESNLAKPTSWCNSNCNPPSTISGYAILNNGSAVLTGTASQYPQGWADIRDGSGVGVLIGQEQLAAYGNKSLEFRAGGPDVRIGLWAAENNTTGPSTTTANAPYYAAWPQWDIQNGWLEFHTSALAAPANDHLMLQYPLLGRAAYTWYNTAAVFPNPLLDPTEETNYYAATFSAASPSVSNVTALDSVMGSTSISNLTCNARGGGSTPTVCAWRYRAWAAPGGANQMDYQLSGLYNFIRRGFTGQYVNSAYMYKFVAEYGFPMSDGFRWNSHASETRYFGYPTATSTNYALSIAGSGGQSRLNIEQDFEHANAQGYDTYYLMSGDETIKESYMEAVPPFFANNTGLNNYTTVSAALWNDRSIGNLFKWAAHVYTFLNSVGSASDATTILSNAQTVYTVRLQPDLCAFPGYPTGCTPDSLDAIPQVGQSKVRGVSNVFKDTSIDTTGCPSIPGSVRTAGTFMTSRKLEGMQEFYQIVSTSWAYRTQFFDYMYGAAQWAFGEMMVDNGTAVWSNNGFRYKQAMDYANACGTVDWANLSNSETIWYHWTTLAQYLGPLSATNLRLLAQEIQRNSSQGALDEMYHDTLGTAIYNVLHPIVFALTTAPITGFIDNGGGSYTISWVTPSFTTTNRVKWGTKTIVDWIGFSAGSYSFIGNPATTQNWFASTEASGIPAPVTGLQSMTVSTGTTGLLANNFMVKVLTNGTAPPVSTITSSMSGVMVIQGAGTIK